MGAFPISKKVNSGLGNTQRQTCKAEYADQQNNIEMFSIPFCI